MSRPPRLCACGAIVPHGIRCACQVASTRARNRHHDQRRPSAAQRGYNSEWRKARLEWLRLHPRCKMCGAEANTVDHIKRHRGNKTLLLNWYNLQSLCAHCHNSTKQRLERQADV